MNDQMTVQDVFVPGTWWLLNDQPVVVGGPNAAAQGVPMPYRVWLYGLDDAGQPRDIPVCFLMLRPAIAMIKRGDLAPIMSDDLSRWDDAEQERLRSL